MLSVQRTPSPSDPFVLHHSHTDSAARGIAHNSCNINFNTTKTQVSVFLHNAKSYDAHLLLSHASPSKHGQVSCIPRTTEQYLSFQIGNLVFKDSMQFMNKSLDNLVSSINKSELGTSQFLKTYVSHPVLAHLSTEKSNRKRKVEKTEKENPEESKA